MEQIYFTPNNEEIQECDVNLKDTNSNLKVITKGRYFKYFKNLPNAVSLLDNENVEIRG